MHRMRQCARYNPPSAGRRAGTMLHPARWFPRGARDDRMNAPAATFRISEPVPALNADIATAGFHPTPLMVRAPDPLASVGARTFERTPARGGARPSRTGRLSHCGSSHARPRHDDPERGRVPQHRAARSSIHGLRSREEHHARHRTSSSGRHRPTREINGGRGDRSGPAPDRCGAPEPGTLPGPVDAPPSLVPGQPRSCR